MNLEIVERSSGYWIVGEHGVEWDEPFVHLSQAINQLNKMLEQAPIFNGCNEDECEAWSNRE
jgi:hypothetical protein